MMRHRHVGSASAIATALRVAVALAITFLGTSAAQAGCVQDAQGANDEPGQKDLTKFCKDAPVGTTQQVSWNWDDIQFSSASSNNSEDGCALYDTDGDGNVNFAVCVTVGTDGVSPTFIFKQTTVYSCGDDKTDRCTQPVTELVTATSTCTVTNPSPDDPFATGDFSPNDTKATCTVRFADFTGTPSLINVCSYPSQQPNSDPNDCVLVPGTPNACEDPDACTDPAHFCDPQICDPSANNGQGACVPGTPTNCDDSNACTDDSCSNALGQCVHTTSSCDDGNACTTDTCDPSTGCGHSALSCDDNNA